MDTAAHLVPDPPLSQFSSSLQGVCSPNAQDSKGWTALHVALVFEMESTANLLAPHTDILLRDSDGMTPVDMGLVVGTPMSAPPSPFAM